MGKSTTAYVAEIEDVKVCGIPCIIAVTDYDKYTPYCYPAEGGTGEYHLLDRRGYRATWLEAKVERFEEECIQELIYQYMEGE
jgi:hypothetical protein